ncbi:hypothetical protein CI1B_25150 [Bradyrhizobium ivorense]|uniref:Uncharacterized protein n=1 Tax=Bradyrhizobium ivorense TaxID=2511166 RepID=A0A508T5Q4_9BRAD|nr:hypothetical protein CI1B_25150 [Bradyrhizobium ivorense]
MTLLTVLPRLRTNNLKGLGATLTLETVRANLLDRQFADERPNQKWNSDFTYL